MRKLEEGVTAHELARDRYLLKLISPPTERLNARTLPPGTTYLGSVEIDNVDQVK